LKAARLGALMLVNYALNAASFRLLARGSYLGVGITDGLIAWWGFAMVRHIAKAETRTEQAAYTVGGIAGSLLGMWLTR
jgi:hypothetical protein